jgi:hypothetical protein
MIKYIIPAMLSPALPPGTIKLDSKIKRAKLSMLVFKLVLGFGGLIRSNNVQKID